MAPSDKDFAAAERISHVAPLNGLSNKVDPAHTALIVIDVQNDFCAPGGMMDKEGLDLSAAQEMAQRLPPLISAARAAGVGQVFWPSSIAVFGPGSGPVAAQHGHRLPATVYGISKNAGEHWCAWYRKNRGVDVRSVRYPGLIGTLAPPGGGTTDYAVEVFDHLEGAEPYRCFLEAGEVLPMMHMDDAVNAALGIMSSPLTALRCTEAYNIQAMSFSPEELFREIRRHVPDFAYSCIPDFRQEIAAGWPNALEDSMARMDWGWSPKVALPQLVDTMMASRLNRVPIGA